MSTVPQNPERASSVASPEAVRALVTQLFLKADGPPYTAVLKAIPSVVAEVHCIVRGALGDTSGGADGLVELLSAKAKAAIDAGELSDDGLIGLAEQFDQLAVLCEQVTKIPRLGFGESGVDGGALPVVVPSNYAAADLTAVAGDEAGDMAGDMAGEEAGGVAGYVQAPQSIVSTVEAAFAGDDVPSDAALQAGAIANSSEVGTSVSSKVGAAAYGTSDSVTVAISLSPDGAFGPAVRASADPAKGAVAANFDDQAAGEVDAIDRADEVLVAGGAEMPGAVDSQSADATAGERSGEAEAASASATYPSMGATEHGVTLDGATLDGATHDGATHDGAIHDSVIHDGATHDGATLDGATQDGATHDGVTHDGATHDGTTHDGATHDGAIHDSATHDGVTHEDAAVSLPEPDAEVAIVTTDLDAVMPELVSLAQDAPAPLEAFIPQAVAAPADVGFTSSSIDDLLELDSLCGMTETLAALTSAIAAPPVAASVGSDQSEVPLTNATAPEFLATHMVGVPDATAGTVPDQPQTAEAEVADDQRLAEVAHDQGLATTDAGAADAAAFGGGEQSAESDDALWQMLGVGPLSGDEFECPLAMNDAQQELLKYLVDDQQTAMDVLTRAGQRLIAGDVDAAASDLQDLSSSTERTMTFFGHKTLLELSQLVGAISGELKNVAPETRPLLAELLKVIGEIWSRCSAALVNSVEQRWPLQQLIGRVAEAIAPAAGAEDNSAAMVMPDAAVNPAGEGDVPLELSPEQLQGLVPPAQAESWGSTPLTLSTERASSLQFMINDVKQAADALVPLAPRLADLGVREETCGELMRLSGAMEKATADFDFKSLKALIVLVGDIGAGLHAVNDEMVCELSVRLLAIHSLILQHATGLEVGMETSWPLHTLTSRIHRLLEGKSLAAGLLNWHKGEHEKIAEVDGIIDWGDTPPKVDIADDHSDWKRPAVVERLGGQADVIRIDASVIDGLMGTVGEMVQQRSRLQMFAEQLRREFPGHPTMEELYRTAETLERSMVTVQTGIMGTRLQPLSRLFDNYPRVLRDVARIADREVIVEIEGGSTQVDKSIIDGLGEPLMAILRYCASRSIEKPADRESKNKPKEGTIKLSARDQGSQVVITVQDDGAGFDRKECCGWLVDCGMMTFEQAEKLGDDELAAMMFEGDVTTSPLRRVASMLQVSVGGSFMVHSSPAAGARIDLVVPMKSAILSAVLVAAGDSAYTVPLQAIIEITRIERTMIKTIAGAATMRLRDDVFPLLDARKLFGDKAVGEPAFALVITTGQTRAALGVDRVISKQDMIIKQIDDAGLRRGPFSGTTLTREGKVSLVLDVQRMLAAALDHR